MKRTKRISKKNIYKLLQYYCTWTDLGIYFAKLLTVSPSVSEILERLPTEVHEDFQDQSDFKLERFRILTTAMVATRMAATHKMRTNTQYFIILFYYSLIRQINIRSFQKEQWSLTCNKKH